MDEIESPYFALQAEVGVSKHLGGFKATRELAGLCRIGAGSCVLDVGCGTGITARWLAKEYGCRVVGIDISERMIERAKEKNSGGPVEFRVADAQKLPFEKESFDAVISESVVSFVGDKQKAMREYVRVAKKGGYVGLCEVTWQKGPPENISGYLFNATGGARPETESGWRGLLEKAGLGGVHARSAKFGMLEQFKSELERFSFIDGIKGMFRLMWLYASSPAWRRAIHKMIKDSVAMPRGFLGYFGYGVYSGRKKA